MEKVLKNEKGILLAGAIAAGFLSGLLGAGGGIILYFVLGALYGKSAKENLVISSVAVMFFCTVSLFFYKGNQALVIEKISEVVLPAILGGITGALLLAKLPTKSVKKMFSIIVILSGILMILR